MAERFDNRYEIIRRLGSGGMADVFLARDTHLGRDVAIKILYKRYARDEEFVTRFRREAEAAAGLNHPHIVSIYDRGEAESSYYIAMEYLEGKSLKEMIGEKGRLEPPVAIDIASQILQALQFAHEHHVIHRDIKPHNIMIGSRGQVKVTDFGIARAGASSQMTETGSIIGTAQYLSPEQAKGKAVEQSSDLYSLGIVLYEMLTGRVPFEGENPVAVALKHLSDLPVPPQALVPQIPDNLNTVVMRALAKDPFDRYKSAEEFLTDLERCRQNVPVAPYVPIDVQQTSVIRPGSAGMMGVGMGAPATGQTTMRPAAGAARPRPQKGRKWPWALLALVAVVALAAGIYFLAFMQTEAVSVPSVIGLDRTQAEDALKAQGFKTELNSEEYSDSVPAGNVISQDPPAGSRLKKGGTVRLVVSKGSNRTSVPDLVNQTASYAESKLRELGFDPERQPDVFSDTVAEGTVISQDPPAGTQAQKGSTIKYLVSKGKEPPKEVIVPSVVGLTTNSARTKLEEVKLTLGPITEQNSSTVPVGQIISQIPAAGEKADEGSPVSVTVSKGNSKVQVPTVTGMYQTTAESVVTSAGLVPQVVVQTTADNTKWQTVKSINPPAGNMVDAGSTVTLTVWVSP